MSEDIIINAVSPKVRYVADGMTKSFSFVFPIFSEQDMDVYINDTLIQSGYSVTGAGKTEGGEVVFTTPPENGQIITLLRNLEIKRTSDFQESGAFRAKAINYELDYQIACLQQLNEQIGRSVSFPPYSANAQAVTLPEPENGKAIVWDKNGATLRNSNLAYDDLEQLMIETKSTVLSAEQNVISKEALAQSHEQNAANSKEEAHKWAVGTIQEQPNGSAKYWAENAKAVTEGTLNETQITNCITKIPQDIKLELSNGTLTLKAGSKVYVPNGVGRFDEVIIPSDISRTIVWNGLGFITCESNNYIDWASIDYCFSGDAAPDSPVNGSLWYDTANNIIKRYDGSKWTAKKSLPIAILNASTTVSKQSIDQVFNGFGYIGSTNFALPGVELLMPNGRNTDGSLNNIKHKVPNVVIGSLTQGNGTYVLCLRNLGFKENQVISGYYISDKFITTPSQHCLLFNTSTNYFYATSDFGSTWTMYDGIVQIGSYTRTNGKITELNIKQPLKLADDQEVVHLSQEETISGIKNFETSINTKPKSLSVPNLNGYDLDGNKVGDILIGKSSNGNFYSILRINKQDGSFGAQVGLRRDSSDNIYLEGITPSATDNSTKLATTAWVRQYGAQLDYTAGVTITGDGDKTAPSNGVLMINASSLNNYGDEQVTIVTEGQTFYYGNGTVNLDNPHIGQVYFPMKSGQAYNIKSKNWARISVKFFPYV